MEAEAETKADDKSAGEASLFSAKKKGPVFKRREKKAEVADKVEGEGNQMTAAQLRVARDLSDLDLPTYVTMKQNKDSWNEFSLVIKPNMGYWTGGLYEFEFKIPAKYPFDGPKVQCIDKIYHPNIDLEGHVCVNVLRPWKPTYSVQIVLFGLLFLFSHPNPNDPLNKEAAADLRADPKGFERNVTKAMRGGYVGSTSFTKNRGL